MDMMEKLTVLADAAKYDVSCASSGSSGRAGRFGTAEASGICHSWSGDGRCVSLLKVLYTNKCMYRCAYCVNSVDRDCRRAEFTPKELCDLTVDFYRRNYIEGLFLSSGVTRSADYTMERMVQAIRLLRAEGFAGYIHMKTIPGASGYLVDEAALLCDRLSINIELPSQRSLMLLAPEKNAKAILEPMGHLARQIDGRNDPRARAAPPPYAPAGQSTQMIVGASPETDRNILQLSQGLYKRYRLRRVYYSAFIPAVRHPLLPGESQPPLRREHRLYQADWLLRFYGFKAEEILDERNPQLDMQLDPKCAWALNNLHYFPVDVATAPMNRLLRVPGIGQVSAQRILAQRRYGGLTLEDVRRCGVVMKRAQYFIICRGRSALRLDLKPLTLRAALTGATPILSESAAQTSLFDLPQGDLFAQVAREKTALQLPGV